MSDPQSGTTVYLIGAGPGDPGLLTLRGLEALRKADVVLHDRLVGEGLLHHARAGALIEDVGKAPGERRVTQEQINELILHHARAGRVVARLKGGDPFVFGRGYEELEACRLAGISCEVIPGVTSVTAAPVVAGVPITHRDIARSFGVATAQIGEDAKAGDIDYAGLAAMDTVILLMASAKLEEVSVGLMKAGRPSHTPAVFIESATLPEERVVRATLGTLVAAARQERVTHPMVLVIGEVVALAAIEAAATGALPLSGRRVVVTRAVVPGDPLGAALRAAGAACLAMPLIRISHDEPAPELDGAIARLGGFDWLVFTSRHGVEGFFRRFAAAGLDVRTLGGVKIAVVGAATGDALRGHGLLADFIPSRFTGAAMALELASMDKGRRGRVLCPRSSIARSEVPDILRSAGWTVEDVTAYHVHDTEPSERMLARVRDGVDAVVFHSPSGVRGWLRLGLPIGQALVACIGPVTAAEARAHGMDVRLVAEEHTSSGLGAALVNRLMHRQERAS